MSFALKCPKCASGNIIIEKDARSYFQRAVPSLHCMMCGKVVYGEKAVEAEYLRQKAAYENNVSKTKVEKNPRPTHRQKAPLSKEPSTTPASVKQGENSRITEQAKPLAEGICAWRGCSKSSRDTSKYCSRACSNKNARWRHAQRKKAQKSGEAAVIRG